MGPEHTIPTGTTVYTTTEATPVTDTVVIGVMVPILMALELGTAHMEATLVMDLDMEPIHMVLELGTTQVFPNLYQQLPLRLLQLPRLHLLPPPPNRSWPRTSLKLLRRY